MKWEPKPAATYINTLLPAIVENVRKFGLSDDDIPNWLKTPDTRIGLIGESMLGVVDPSESEGGGEVWGDWKSDSALLLKIADFQVGPYLNSVPPDENPKLLATDPQGEGEPATILLKGNMGFMDCGTAGRHRAIQVMDLKFDLMPNLDSNEVGASRLVHYALYLHASQASDANVAASLIDDATRIIVKRASRR